MEVLVGRVMGTRVGTWVSDTPCCGLHSPSGEKVAASLSPEQRQPLCPPLLAQASASLDTKWVYPALSPNPMLGQRHRAAGVGRTGGAPHGSSLTV